MKSYPWFLIPAFVLLGCAGGFSVLGTPTVLSDVAVDLLPEVTNAREIQRTMGREYPPLLRDAGIGGRVVLRLSVDEAGAVQRVALEESSTHRALDEVAVELARMVRFKPAERAGEAVPVLISVPLDLIPPSPQPARAVRRGIG